MKVSEMELITTLASTGSMTLPAEKLLKAQPNVSKELRDLEDRYKVKLFERSHAGVRVTEAGEVFVNTAKRILDELSNLSDINENMKNRFKEIHIGTVKQIYTLKGIREWVDSALSFGALKIYIHEEPVLKIIEKIAKDKYDIGYISIPDNKRGKILRILESHNIESKHMFRQHNRLLIGKDHPLIDKNIQSLDDLKDYPEIIIGSNSMNVDESISINNKRVIVDGVGSLIEYMKYVKGSYMWSPIIPEEILENNDLTFKECAFKHEEMNDYIIYKSKTEKKEIKDSFLEKLESFIKRLEKEN